MVSLADRTGGAKSGETQTVFDSPVGIDQANLWTNFLGAIPGSSLWVVWVGGNDIRDAARTVDSSEASQKVIDAVANINTIVTTLANAGAQNFLIPNLSDLGIVPEAGLAGTYVQDATALTMQFNSGLASEIAKLENTLPVSITELDVFAAINEVLSDPTEFGFSNVIDPCLAVGVADVCANPAEYLFWDGMHPTAALDAQTAAFATAAVTVLPIPAALPLLLTALAGVSVWRRNG